MSNRVIAAIRSDADFERALKSGSDTVFLLSSSITELEGAIKKAHEVKKKVYIHLDLAMGIGKDKAGIEFLKMMGIDGIISTRANLIKAAKEIGLITVQRFFIVDSRSVDTTVESLRQSKADMIEIMPGIVPKIIKSLRCRVDTPIIAGGLIDTPEEIVEAISCGAYAISTGCEALWNL